MQYGDQFFAEIYKYSPIGLVILDQDIQLVDANENMLDSFQIGGQNVRGKHFGDVFGCSRVAGTGRGCGDTEDCALCDIRSGIASVLTEDVKIKNATVSHSFVIDGEQVFKWFKLCASAISTGSGRYAVVSFADITKEKNYEMQLERELTFDLPTGALNKKNLTDILAKLPGTAGAYPIVSVGIIDMDDFKNVNDNYGHLTGDEVLTHFSDIAHQHMRQNDIIGRFGGEEFMVILPGVSARQAAQVIERIHSALKRHFLAQGVSNISFSAGLIDLTAGELSRITKDEIIRMADRYMYQAKRLGKQMLVAKDFSVKFL